MEDSHSRPLAKNLIDACSKALETTSEELLVKALKTARKALSLVVGMFSYHVALSQIEIEQKGMCLAESIENLKGKVASKDALQKARAQENASILETIAA